MNNTIKSNLKRTVLLFCGSIFMIIIVSCNKLHIDPPTTTITTSEVFSDSANAASAISGIYALISSSPSLHLGTGGITADCGESADELLSFQGQDPLSTNTLFATTGTTDGLWDDAAP